MTQILNFVEAEKILAKYIPLAHDIIGKDITLERMLPLMAAIGNPERKLRVVHVAGTSGKTSTAYYIASLLQASGKKVGLTVSPHMDSVAERVQIDLVPLAEKDFCSNLSEFLDLFDSTDTQPTYYELLMAFAYWYFAKIGVDYAVIETGLGGLHDGSNVAKRADKICIITDIGYDHMHILGDSLPKISLQKAGIIHPGNETFMYRQVDEVSIVFQRWCKDKSAQLHEIEPKPMSMNASDVELHTLPLFKQRNWLLAYAAYEFIERRDGLAKLSDSSLISSLKTYVPGRMDEVIINGKKVIMDGAHNGQKMEAFVNSFQDKYPDTNATVLLAMKQGKEYEEVIKSLRPITGALIATDFYVDQDRISNGVNPEMLVEAAKNAGITNSISIQDQIDALDRSLAVTRPGGIVIVTGSLYLLSQLRYKYKGLLHA